MYQHPGWDSHLGRAEDARITWAELLKVNPDFSLSQRARVLPYKDPGDFQRIAEGLAKAGLPQPLIFLRSRRPHG